MTEKTNKPVSLQVRIFILLVTGPFIAAENMVLSLLERRVWDDLSMEQSSLFLWGVIFSGYLILLWGIESINSINHIFFSKEIACQLKEQVYSCYIRSKKFLYEKKSLSSTINHDIPMLEEEFYYSIVHCLVQGGAVLLAFLVTFSVHILYGIFCFVVMAIPILLSTKKADLISEVKQKILEEKEEYTGFLSEMGQGKKTIRQYQMLDTVLKRHEDFAARIALLGAKKKEQLKAAMISSQSINRFVTEVASLTGFYLVSRGELTIGWVMAFSQLSESMTFSLVSTIQTGIHIYSCRLVRSKIWEQYGLSNHASRAEKSRKSGEILQSENQRKAEENKAGGCHCHIESCKLGEKQVLKGVDFFLAPGEKLLITGENGSGKTTLLKILLGLNQEFEGFVEWTDKEGNLVTEGEEIKQIAYIAQNPFVFEGSVKENILLDMAEEERYSEIKKTVGLKIEDEKRIENRKRNISGGEMQKIELARAIYSGRGVLILDEPYSALDQETLLETERYLLNDPDRTVIVVSHAEREETRKLYSRHLVLAGGVLDGR